MINKFYKLSRRIRDEEKGVALIEFAYAAPVFFMLLFGVFDYSYGLYVRTVLQGAVDAAGRKASLERTTTATLDAEVLNSIKNINKSGTTDISRRFYQNYSDVQRPEDMVDTNNNKMCDPGEQFIDRNGNGVWNADVGLPGRGGAQDVVVYRVAFTYKRIFPLWSLIGQSQDQRFVATTILRNQPFTAQAARVGVPTTCK